MEDGSTTATADPEVASSRPCTRCDGTQELVAGASGMGSYRCQTCQMVVGFDRESDPAEFLIDRGTPARYTREVFGERLTADERRLL